YQIRALCRPIYAQRKHEWSECMDCLIHHMLRTTANRFPAEEAVVHGDQRLTYAETSGLVAGLAQNLRDAGVRRGERVGIYLEAGIPQVFSIFGVSQAGCVFVPINAFLFPEQVAHIARDCTISVLITTATKLESLSAILASTPSVRFVVVIDGEPHPQISLPV